VVSSLGKGFGVGRRSVRLLQGAWLQGSVPCAKLDPYLNVDPGTMSPLFSTAEVFVTDDWRRDRSRSRPL